MFIYTSLYLPPCPASPWLVFCLVTWDPQCHLHIPLPLSVVSTSQHSPSQQLRGISHCPEQCSAAALSAPQTLLRESFCCCHCCWYCLWEGLFLHQSKSGEVSKGHQERPKYHALWKKPGPKNHILYDSICEICTIDKSIETERRLVFAKCRLEGRENEE